MGLAILFLISRTWWATRRCALAQTLFNRCARCTLGRTKLCVRCTTTKGFTRMHHKLVILNRYFLQNFLLAKMNHLTNQWLPGF